MLQFEDFKNSYKPNQKDGKIVIFGAGTVGRLAHLALKDHGIEIDYFCDSDKRKQKHKIEDKLIISPEDLYKFDKIKTYIFLSNQYLEQYYLTYLEKDLIIFLKSLIC